MSDIITDNPIIYNAIYYFIDYFDILTFIIIILFIIGVFTKQPSTFLFVNFFIKILLALYLIYRFNAYRKNKIIFTDLDKKICYSAGVYIIVISFFDIGQAYVNEFRSKIDLYTVPIINKLFRYKFSNI
jgi:hypothetical protein